MPRERQITRALGAAALAGAVIHGSIHLARGEPEEWLWACNLATWMIGLGLLLRAPMPVAIGTMWLAVGLPLWVIDLLAGGELIPASVFIHPIALCLGLVGVRRLGLPPGAWWRALLTLAALHLACRLFTTPAANINAAVQVGRAWDRLFPTYLASYVAGVLSHLAAFLLLQRLLPRLHRSE
ncbi:MAG: hypothetical protein EXR72_26140 [Myxococcales bacterium]|nr:hypothetical protein [Myxococcales bacterium]